MASFNNYTHSESIVQAIQLNAETSSAVSQALGNELVKGLLATFNVTYNSNERCYEYTFRYKTDSVDSILTSGNYLVQLNTATYVVRDAATFESEYLPTYEDEALMPDNPQTPMEAIITFIKKYFPTIEVDDKLDSDQMGKVLESLKTWYDSEKNQFTIHFNHVGMIDPTGLAELFAGFPQASYMNESTTFILDLSNGNVQEEDANKENNIFNYAALQSLYGELMKLDSAVVKRLVQIDFSSKDGDAPSAIAPSVTDAQWSTFCTDVMAISGITSTAGFKR